MLNLFEVNFSGSVAWLEQMVFCNVIVNHNFYFGDISFFNGRCNQTLVTILLLMCQAQLTMKNIKMESRASHAGQIYYDVRFDISGRKLPTPGTSKSPRPGTQLLLRSLELVRLDHIFHPVCTTCDACSGRYCTPFDTHRRTERYLCSGHHSDLGETDEELQSFQTSWALHCDLHVHDQRHSQMALRLSHILHSIL